MLQTIQFLFRKCVFLTSNVFWKERSLFFSNVMFSHDETCVEADNPGNTLTSLKCPLTNWLIKLQFFTVHLTFSHGKRLRRSTVVGWTGLLIQRPVWLFRNLLVPLQIKWLIRGRKEGGSLRVQERFIAGSLAGATAQTIIYPMEVSVNMSRCSARKNLKMAPGRMSERWL